MKKILALAVLTGALSSCMASVQVTLNAGISSNTIGGAYAYDETVGSGTVRNTYTCTDRNTQVEISFNWTGNLKEYAFEFYGQTNAGPDATYPRYPAVGFYQVSSRSGVNFANKSVTEFLDYNADQVHPFRVTTQAVIVTPKPSATPLGATLIRIVGRDKQGNQFSYNASGKILVYTNGNCPTP